jgi:manganese oxidase
VQLSGRTNGGLRDSRQLHQYAVGEFGPGGLYHNTAGGPGFEGTTRGIKPRFHYAFPLQGENVVWTFDGTLPPKLLMARYGQPTLMRHHDALPIDPAANTGFGLHTLSTHEHNGHSPAESDGYTQAFFFPGQFYDYRWPLALAGHDSINTDRSDPRAGAPDGAGGIIPIPGDFRETMSTHWFHDHMLDFTAQNVYKGNAAMMNYYSSIDRGNEGLEDGVNLRLPSGTALDFGNRDYDVNLVIADKAWDEAGQLFFNIFNLDGFLGDQMLTNWSWKPYLDVRARRYRFRILNGSVSRYFELALVRRVEGTSGELAGPPGSNVSYDRVPFHMVANDGNIMEHAVAFDGSTPEQRLGILPSQGIAERYDIVVDFGAFAPGTRLYMVNLFEHRDGGGPKEEIPLEDVLDGTYAPEVQGGRNRTDPCVTAFLEFRVQPYAGTDLSMNPADFVAGRRSMLPLPRFTREELEGAVHRSFEFGRSEGTDAVPWTIRTDQAAAFPMDPRRLSAAPAQSQIEIWHLKNGGGGWSHPVHIHFEEAQIIKRGGEDPPEWERWARKDVFRLGPMADSTDSIDLVIRFREFLGTFMEHCHNTQHEDNSMLLRWDVERPGQVRVMPTPLPSWDGVKYVPSFALPTFRTGDLEAAEDAAENPDFGRLD